MDTCIYGREFKMKRLIPFQSNFKWGIGKQVSIKRERRNKTGHR